VQTAVKTSRIAPFAASLSLLLPGLGQAALGRRRRGLLLAIPAMAIAVAAAAIATSVANDPTSALDLVPGPESLPALLALEGGLLAWHLAAIVDAERLARGARPVRGRRRVPALLKIARDNLWTTLRRQDLRDLARLAARVDVRRVARVLFVPPKYRAHLTDAEIARIQHVVRSIFDEPAPPPDNSLAEGHCP